jgi:hypothetical protein
MAMSQVGALKPRFQIFTYAEPVQFEVVVSVEFQDTMLLPQFSKRRAQSRKVDLSHD